MQAKPDMAAHVCNPNATMQDELANTEESLPEALGEVSSVDRVANSKELSQTRWKEETVAQGCHLTFTLTQT